MKKSFHFNQSFILLSIAIVMVIVILILVIVSSISSNKPVPFGSIPSPTPVPYTKNADGSFNFTPLQKTIISETTEKEVVEKQKILSKSLQGQVTVYEVPSSTPLETDEIWTNNGRVVFESINVFNDKIGMPPKVNYYSKQFGPPEKLLKGVSPLGKHISAYIYAQDGFTLFVNHNTNTVYEVHRYTPMSTSEYEDQFVEYLQPAPEYPREFLGD